MRPFKKLSLILIVALCGFVSWALPARAETPESTEEISADDFLKTDAANFYHEGRYDDALTALSALLDDRPGDPLLLRYRAMTLDRLGRFEVAVKDFKSILDQYPYHVPARFFLANTYNRMGRREEAIQEWRWVSDNAAGTIYEQWANESLERSPLDQDIKDAEPLKWNMAARYGYEYDTNVVLRPSDDALASSGEDEAGRHLMDVVFKNHVVSTATTKVDLQYAARQSLHDSGLDEFNFTSLEFGAHARRRVDWFERAYIVGAKYDVLGGFLDGNTFSFKHRGTVSADTRFTTHTRSVLSYRLTGADYGPDGSNPPQTSRDGMYHDLGLTQYWYSEDFKRYIFGTGEYNHTSTRGGNFDARGFTTRLGFHTPLAWKTDLDASVEYQYANYPHFVSLSSLDTDKRRNSEWDLYIALTHYFTPEVALRIFNRFTNADNSNGFYEYDRNIGGAHLLYSKSF